MDWLNHFMPLNVQRENDLAYPVCCQYGVSQQHLQAYFKEFVFRFNRRFYPMIAFNSIFGIAA